MAEPKRDERAAAKQWTGLPQLGRPMEFDHRRILATALGRLRGKLNYRPQVFELLPPGLEGQGRPRLSCRARPKPDQDERTFNARRALRRGRAMERRRRDVIPIVQRKPGVFFSRLLV